MSRTITPIIALTLAIGLLLTYARPTFNDIRAIQTETREYVQAIERADALRARVNELVARQNSFSTANLERLEALLPDERNDIAFLLSVDALAKQRGLTFGNINVLSKEEIEVEDDLGHDFADIDPAESGGKAGAAGASGVQPYAPVEISFTVTGTYNDFRDFLYDLEHNLLITDITKLNFAESAGDLTDYNLTVRTYAFNTEL